MVGSLAQTPDFCEVVGISAFHRSTIIRCNVSLGMIAMEYMEDASKHEILRAIAGLDKKIDGVNSGLGERIDGVNASLGERIDDLADAVQTLGQHMDDRFEVVDSRLSGVESRLVGVESRLRRVETTTLTKHDLDDRLDNFRGDLVGFIRKEDAKMLAKLK